MKVKARHWVKYDGVWHKKGDVFEIKGHDFNGMLTCVDVVEDKDDNVPEAKTAAETKPSEEQASPVKRGRKRRTEE